MSSVAMDSLKQKGMKNEPKRLRVTKLSLRCISSAFCCAVIGTGAGTFNVELMLMLPNVAERITLIVRRRANKGIHPGACVALDLCLSLANADCVGMTAPEISNPNIYSTTSSYTSSYDSFNYSYQLHTSQTLIIGGVAASIILTYDPPPPPNETTCAYQSVPTNPFITKLIQISLLIIACVETHRRRKTDKANRANKASVQVAPNLFNQNQQEGTFINPNQQPFNPNQQQPGAFNPNAPFNPNQQHQQPGTFIPNPRPTTFPPTSPFQAHQTQTQTYYPPPLTNYSQAQTQTHQTPLPNPLLLKPPQHPPFGQATIAPSQPPQWPGASIPQGHHEMSNTPAPHAAGVFNGGPPTHTAAGGFNGAPPNMTMIPAAQMPQHELSGGTSAPAGFTQIAPPPQQQQQVSQYGTPTASQAGSPPPRYEMYVRTTGADGGANPHEMGGR
ncbi:hypothetical protein VE02_05866 [Pseudogymnoascus sp. 03VT05]|nr:hypothetical protein VE02_05866 [Pseudogymnoascus sp. 03VT05]